MYKLIRVFLFLLPAELSHTLGLKGLSLLHRLGLSRVLVNSPKSCPCELFGLSFPNPVGLAAGLDKNGDYIDSLGALGFGFIEVGTITPKAQAGNPKPRLFRLTKEESIINRMGFNNKGVDYLVERLKNRHYKGLIGVNIGKNLTTSVERALDDYLICLKKVYAYADYIVINLSSPNTPGLRNLQFGDPLDELLAGLMKERSKQADLLNKTVPLLVKIAPDLNANEITQIAQAFLRHKIDGVIATNTTITRDTVSDSKYVNEAGGLSGAVLGPMSTRVIGHLARALKNQIPVVGVGGIIDASGGQEKMQAGASLLQLYSGFIYRGPALIAEVVNGVVEVEDKQQSKH